MSFVHLLCYAILNLCYALYTYAMPCHSIYALPVVDEASSQGKGTDREAGFFDTEAGFYNTT